MRLRAAFRILKRILVLPAVAFACFLLLNRLFPLREEPRYSQLVVDKDGNMLQAFLSPDEKWRMKTELREISPLLRNTILYKEDKYFYFHPGINPVAVARAAFNNLVQQKKTSGASTITMQVARLLYPAPRTYTNKCIEMFRALQLEWVYSKDEILQLYLNLVPYGGNVEGVKAASWLYFGIRPEHVNLSQAVILSVIPNRPRTLHPSTGVHALTAERNKWLRRMVSEGIVSAPAGSEALHESIDMRRRPVPRLAPHLTSRLKAAYPGEHMIHTTLDKSIQDKITHIAFNHHKRLSLMNIHNLSVLVVENRSRKVVGYLGSPDFNDPLHAGQVDGCQAIRSPGSTLKPLVYGMAIDKGLITPAAMVEDVPVNFSGFTPENFNARCNGRVSASSALSHSLNIPAVALLNGIGMSAFTSTMRKCGFHSLRSDREMGLSVILGGCGVRAWELAGMYSMFANGGEYMPLQITSADTGGKPVRIISEAAAFMVNNMLTTLVRPDLPNNFQSSLRVPRIAWKTGTSYGRRDAWSGGYNTRYTVVVWAGNFSGQGVPELTGADIATPLLFDIFNRIDFSRDDPWFIAPESADIRLVCSQTGLPPGDACADLIQDYFIPATSSYQKCNHSREILVTPDESFSYCMMCVPDAGYKKIRVDYLAPPVAAFYAANNIAYKKTPPHNPDCTQLFTDQPPVITMPVHNKEYLLEKNAEQPLQLNGHAGADITWVYWYINDRFEKKAKPGEPVFFIPTEGEYKISCSDDKGKNSNIRIRVRFY